MDEEEKCEDNKHCDGEDASGGKNAVVAVHYSDCVEEEKDELLNQKADHNTVDSTPMDILVDF